MNEFCHLALLRDFSPADIEALEAATAVVGFAEDDSIYRENDLGDDMFIVKSGHVALLRRGRILGISGPGDVFGEELLFGERCRSTDAVARTAVEAYVVARDAFLDFLRSRPRAATECLIDLLSQATARLRNTMRLMDVVAELDQPAPSLNTLADLTRVVRDLTERMVENVDEVRGAAAFIWNRFEACFEPLFEIDCPVVAAQCREADRDKVFQSYFDLPEGTFLAIRLAEGKETLGMLVMRKDEEGTPFSRFAEIALHSLARHLTNAMHRHNTMRESAALNRLRTRRDWQL